MLQLKTVTRTQGNNEALKSGAVRPRTFRFDFVEVDPLIDAFRRMVRGNEFDISEMAITTYLCAKAYGKPFTALPIFLTRGLHHGTIRHSPATGPARTPKDLEGTRVGISRGYTVTTGVWARGILRDEYGVNLDGITWQPTRDEHVAEYVRPDNVQALPAGQDVEELVAAGELSAVIGESGGHPDLRPLLPDPQGAALAALGDRGFYPINHLVVVRDELLDAQPDLAADVFEAFAEAKRLYLQRLRAGAIEAPTAADRLHRSVQEVIGDPLPYGVEPNRRVLDTLVGYAVDQRIIPAAPPLEEIFHPSTLRLVG